MTLPISCFRFFFPLYVLKTRLPPNLRNRVSRQAGEDARFGALPSIRKHDSGYPYCFILGAFCFCSFGAF